MIKTWVVAITVLAAGLGFGGISEANSFSQSFKIGVYIPPRVNTEVSTAPQNSQENPAVEQTQGNITSRELAYRGERQVILKTTVVR